MELHKKSASSASLLHHEDAAEAAAEVYLVPCPDGWLHLTAEEYRQHLKPAPTMAPPVDAEPLLDAEHMAATLDVPKSWVEQAARDGRIPVVRCGRWPRFRRSAVIAALEGRE